jgi:hypothetical protein
MCALGSILNYFFTQLIIGGLSVPWSKILLIVQWANLFHWIWLLCPLLVLGVFVGLTNNLENVIAIISSDIIGFVDYFDATLAPFQSDI